MHDCDLGLAIRRRLLYESLFEEISLSEIHISGEDGPHVFFAPGFFLLKELGVALIERGFCRWVREKGHEEDTRND